MDPAARQDSLPGRRPPCLLRVVQPKHNGWLSDSGASGRTASTLRTGRPEVARWEPGMEKGTFPEGHTCFSGDSLSLTAVLDC